MKGLKKIIISVIIIIYITLMSSSCEFLNKIPEGRVILISVALDYNNFNQDEFGINPLRGTINDSREIAAALDNLSDQANRDFYWIPMFQLGLDDTNLINFPTTNNILNVFNFLSDNDSYQTPLIYKTASDSDLTLNSSYSDYNLKEKVQSLEINSNDLLIFNYSGHGFDSGQLFVVNKLINNGNGPELEYAELYPDDLMALSTSLDCKVLLITDSCFSGNIVPLSEYTVNNIDPQNNIDTAIEKIQYMFSGIDEDDKTSKDVFALSATTSYLLSYESGSFPYHGLFTAALLEVIGWSVSSDGSYDLGQLDDNIPSLKNGKITLDQIYSEIKKRLDYDSQKSTVIGGRDDLILFNF